MRHGKKYSKNPKISEHKKSLLLQEKVVEQSEAGCGDLHSSKDFERLLRIRHHISHLR